MNSFSIQQIKNIEALAIVAHIAQQTWPISYKEMITEDQIQYMLDLFYAPEALQEQFIKLKHDFYLISKADKPIGFASVAWDSPETKQCKLHKLYILPDYQACGAGKALLQKIIAMAKEKHQENLFLNVNRKNPALYFYQKIGFEIIELQDIPIGNNYEMNDYLMKLSLE